MSNYPTPSPELSPQSPNALTDDITSSALIGIAKANTQGHEQIAPSSPWSAYGELGGEATQTTGIAPELPQPAVIPHSSNASDRAEVRGTDASVLSGAKKFLRHEAEMREISRARFELSIDSRAIKDILSSHPETLQYADPDNPTEEELQRQAELQHMLDCFAELPEKLEFEPGITLVVGENGSGKSTLTRALQLSLKARNAFDMGYGGNDFTEFKDSQLDPDRFHGEGGVTDPSVFSLMIAKHMDVEQLASFGKNHYLDATSIYGSFKAERWGERKGLQTNALDTYARSHSQFINYGLFGYLEKEKATYSDMLANNPERRTNGPAVIFIDEVENGLSPKNHRKIKAKINDHIIPGSIVICASNSEVLYYDHSVARIDLEHPELGIHKPIDHPDIYDLSDFTER